MAKNKAYEKAEQKIEAARRTGATELDLSGGIHESSKLNELPESLGQLTALQSLNLYENNLTNLPDWLGQLTELKELNLSFNRLSELPVSLGQLYALRSLDVFRNRLSELPSALGCLRSLELLELSFNQLECLPESLGQLSALRSLHLKYNRLKSLPESLGNLSGLTYIELFCNPLNPELAAAYADGLEAVKRYLRSKAESQIQLNEAKLILIGEGEVGKSCLLAALRDDPWEEGKPTTHGIEIKPVTVDHPEQPGTEITLNGWDFGGQKVYRPTHQLFFSAPAVYLVVWKPREGPQQGFVKEWIELVKHREPEAKILVVATHGGPGERQPDIDRQELWDLFGRATVLDFFLVESKPDEMTGERAGIAQLKQAIARVAASLPEMGRSVPKRWAETRVTLQDSGAAYLPLQDVMGLCRERKMEEDEAGDFIRISHRLGHLIHYAHDETLRDMVVLKPDWLSTAISFVLDDRETREGHGLVSFTRLGLLWNDPGRPGENRYPPKLHPIFRRLMERFDLSYRVAEAQTLETDGTSLIAQLVPDVRPDSLGAWQELDAGDGQQLQICRIVEKKTGQSAAAEGLFYQLIVRLHKYSLGRLDYETSVHWQRGLVLEDEYGARALLEHTGNDIRLTVRSPYPERFLSALTYEVKWLVESFWPGLQCDVMVPCLLPPCIGLFDVGKLIQNKARKKDEQPCPVCNEWQSIEELLHNAPAARPNPLEELLANSAEMSRQLTQIRLHQHRLEALTRGGFSRLEASEEKILGKVERAYTSLMHTLLDEAKDGPRLFSFAPVDPGFLDKPKWVSAKFRLILWCEHSRLPLPVWNGPDSKAGVYELEIPREWFKQAAPFLKPLLGMMGFVLPIAASADALGLSSQDYKSIEKELDLSQKSVDTMLQGGVNPSSWQGPESEWMHREPIQAQGAVLRQLHAWLKEKDPGFGGLVRVANKREEFLWVHRRFETEY